MNALGPAASLVAPKMESSASAPSSPDKRSGQQHATLLFLNPSWFRACWCAVIASHALLASYYWAVAKLHRYLGDKTAVVYALITTYLNPEIPSYFPIVNAACLVIMAGHIIAIVTMCVNTVRSRQLCFEVRNMAKLSPSKPSGPRLGRPGLRTSLQETYRRVFGRFGWLGIDGSLAGQFFVLRELAEVACQIIQANHLSRLIGTIWINRLFALVIVVNCWSTPFVRLVCRRHRNPALRRVLEMITDALINVAYGVVIPYAILYPFQRDFNTTTRMFDGTVYYQDGWFATTTRNLQQLFISSWFNFICTIGPGFSMLSCMSTIKSCVHPQNNRVVDANTHGTDTFRVPGEGIRIRNAYLRLTKVASIILSSAGLFVLIIHLHATLVANLGGNSGCLLELRPWFKTKYTCVVLEASCTQQGINAPQLALEDAVLEMDPNGIRSLVLSHCPQIEMPTQLRALLGLEQLKIYNSTIKTWEMDAAIDASTKPGLQFVYIIETNMSGIPPALLHRDLPLRLTDIEFSGTNLTRIPSDLHEYWSHVHFLCLEASPGITEIPPSTAQMPLLSQLNLAGNGIAAVPDNQFAANAFYSVNLGGNPLRSLPIELGFTLLLHDIRIQHTEIASLPLKWFQEPPPSNIWGTRVILMAGNSPLCKKLLANETDVVEGSTALVPVNRKGLNTFNVDGYPVDCTSVPLERFYPVEYERAWRQKNL